MTERVAKPISGTAEIENFAAQCAHDFNNLLTGVLGNLELMQHRAKRSGVATFDSYIEGARSAAGRAANFSQRLLIFSGRAANEAALVPVNQLVSDLAELLRGQERPVSTELAADAGHVFCDPTQLEIAVAELLANAREASPERLPLSIVTSLRTGTVLICVIDSGSGMDAGTLSRATQPFFSTKPNGAGKGLGLAIVERFASRAGGVLELVSTPGAGTVARLALPRAKVELQNSAP